MGTNLAIESQNKFQLFKSDIIQKIIISEDCSILTDKISSKQYISKTLRLLNEKNCKSIFVKFKTIQNKPFLTISKLIKISQSINRRVCASQFTLKAIFQYYPQSLLSEIKHKQQKYETFSNIDILKIIKFFVETIKEHTNSNIQLPTFGLNNIKINQQTQTYKATNLHFFPENQQNIFYSPQFIGIQGQQYNVIFSMGMILLSVCLLDQCQECYNHKYGDFCWSVLETKLLKLNEQQINCEIIDLIYWMIQKDPKQRPTFEQFATFYKYLIKDIYSEELLNKNILGDHTTLNSSKKIKNTTHNILSNYSSQNTTQNLKDNILTGCY